MIIYRWKPRAILTVNLTPWPVPLAQLPRAGSGRGDEQREARKPEGDGSIVSAPLFL